MYSYSRDFVNIYDCKKMLHVCMIIFKGGSSRRKSVAKTVAQMRHYKTILHHEDNFYRFCSMRGRVHIYASIPMG